MKIEALRKFSRGNAFLILKILSRVFLVIFGAILLYDDLLWENFGGLRDATGMPPTIGVIDIYEIGGVHIHHSWIGAILVFIASFSLVFIYVNDIKKAGVKKTVLGIKSQEKSCLNKLKEFSRGKVFVGLRIVSRAFLFLFGIFLLLDNLLWNNIGKVAELNGIVPNVGVIEAYSIGGVSLPHGAIGFLLMFISSFSMIFIWINDIKNKK